MISSLFLVFDIQQGMYNLVSEHLENQIAADSLHYYLWYYIAFLKSCLGFVEIDLMGIFSNYYSLSSANFAPNSNCSKKMKSLQLPKGAAKKKGLFLNDLNFYPWVDYSGLVLHLNIYE